MGEYYEGILQLRNPSKDVIEFLNELEDTKHTMILMKTAETAKRLYKSGIFHKALNVGGIGKEPGRRNVFKNTALSREEFNILKELYENGINITFLSVPGEKSKDFADIKSFE